MTSPKRYMFILDEFGKYIDPNFYYFISPLKNKINIELNYFSYCRLVLAFYYNYEDYIFIHNKYNAFEIFKDISENTHLFNVVYLANNQYIIKEYKKLTIEEKEILIQDEIMYNFFNEIESILNLQNF